MLLMRQLLLPLVYHLRHLCHTWTQNQRGYYIFQTTACIVLHTSEPVPGPRFLVYVIKSSIDSTTSATVRYSRIPLHTRMILRTWDDKEWKKCEENVCLCQHELLCSASVQLFCGLQESPLFSSDPWAAKHDGTADGWLLLTTADVLRCLICAPKCWSAASPFPLSVPERKRWMRLMKPPSG